MPHRLIVILGPTASGKSALGVRLAKKFHGVVISADSRQVYRGMDIGTAKMPKKEMRGIPHYLLDVASPKGQYSVWRYVRDVQRVLKTIPSQTPIFLVGGTPFYIQAIIHPESFSAVPPNPALRRRLEAYSTQRLLALLRKKDLARAKNIDQANRRRIIRAIEIASGKPSPMQTKMVELSFVKIGLRVPRLKLYQRIDTRVDRRLKKILSEVRKLHQAGLSWKKLESFGLEYRFGAQCVQKKMTLAEAADRIKFGTHAFARRQMTWWRRETDIHWVASTRQAEAVVRNFLV